MGEKYLQIILSDKGSIFKIYEELTELNNKITVQLNGETEHKWTFFPRDVQMANGVHENVFNNTNHLGDANQSHEIPHHTCYKGCSRKTDNKCWEDVEKKEPWCTVDRNVH